MSSRQQTKLLIENWRSFLNEQQTIDFAQEVLKSLESEKDKIKQVFKQGVEKKKESGGSETTDEQFVRQLEEGGDPITTGVLMGGGLLAAGPVILKIIGNTIKKLLPITGDVSAEYFKENAKKLHDAWFSGIGEILNFVSFGTFSKLSEKVRKSLSEFFFMVLIALMLPKAAAGAATYLAATTFGAKIIAGVEAVLSAIKTGELLAFVTKNIEQILTVAGLTAGMTVGSATGDFASAGKITINFVKTFIKNLISPSTMIPPELQSQLTMIGIESDAESKEASKKMKDYARKLKKQGVKGNELQKKLESKLKQLSNQAKAA